VVALISENSICDQSISLAVDGLAITIASLIVSGSSSFISSKLKFFIRSESFVLDVGSGKVKLTSTYPV
jgi:hypothetical protein